MISRQLPIYKGINILKVVCSFLIIGIHFSIRETNYIDPIYRIAVPIFFIISGFFYQRKTTGRTVKKLLRILMQAIFVYLIYYLFICFWKQTSFIEYLQHITGISDWFKLILVNKVPFEFAGHLWYILAYLYVLTIFYFVPSRQYNTAFILGLTLIAISNILGKWSFLLNISPEQIWTRNFLFTGAPYFSIGIFLRKKETTIREKYQTKKSIFVSLIIVIMLFNDLEKYLLDQYVPKHMGYSDLYFLRHF